MKNYILVLLSFFVVTNAWASSKYNDGDIIFIQSTSSQSKALEEATQSPWTHVGLLFKLGDQWVVHEASATVRATPLKDFIAKSKDKKFVVKRRLDTITRSQRLKMSKMSYAYFGKPYDVLFYWSSDKIYCSEFVYKVYKEAFGIEIGEVQTLAVFNRKGPAIEKLINSRWLKGLKGKARTDKLEKVLQEKVVSPVSQFNDKNLKCVDASPKSLCP